MYNIDRKICIIRLCPYIPSKQHRNVSSNIQKIIEIILPLSSDSFFFKISNMQKVNQSDLNLDINKLWTISHNCCIMFAYKMYLSTYRKGYTAFYGFFKISNMQN